MNQVFTVLSTFLFTFLSLSASAQVMSIKGKITDEKGNPLPFAAVSADDGNTGTSSDAEGRFAISLSPGIHRLTVTYLGYERQEIEVNTADGGPVQIKLRENSTQLNEIQVYGELTRGQAKALNTQKRSLTIRQIVDAEQFLKYPDVSAAETVQRLPGISIVRDQGEGEFVQIRGVPEQYNSLTLNGQRIPAIEPDAERAVGLDLVQSYLIQTISVNKSLSADMDGDAIGGMVDFQLKEAGPDQELELYAGYGYNNQETEFEDYGKDIITGAAIASKRFMDEKLGVLLAGSYFNTDRGSIFNSQRFTDLESNSLWRRRTTDYDVKRERYGLVGNFDYRLNPDNKWNFTVNYNRYKDFEIRRQAIYTFENTREERRIRNRVEDQELMFYMLKGEHNLNRVRLDYAGSFAVGREDLPDRTEWRFRRTVPGLADLSRSEQAALSANTTFGIADPLNFTRVDFDPRFTEEDNLSGAVNIQFPLGRTDRALLKTGIKYRGLEREYFEGSFTPELLPGNEIPGIPEGTFGFTDVTFTDPEFSSLGFDLNPGDLNYPDDLGGYRATEDVWAAYLMNTTYWSSKLSMVVGVRMEATSTSYTAFDDQRTGEGSYVNVLPSAHFTYQFNDNNQLRVAYSSGISRPNYTALVPFESIGDDEINRGNEDLEAITAQNFDVMFERYTGNLGFLGLGVFYKAIDNQIVSAQVGTENGLPVFSPVNGATADVFGFEVSMNRNLSQINIPVTINANYTFTESNSDFGDDRDNLPLANSPKHMANLSFLFDDPNSGFSGVVAGVYRDFIFNKFEDTDDSQEGNEEIWLDNTFHLDLSLIYAFNDNFSLKLQLNNLTNQANTEVTGKPSEESSQWSETESYGFWGVFGVTLKF